MGGGGLDKSDKENDKKVEDLMDDPMMRFFLSNEIVPEKTMAEREAYHEPVAGGSSSHGKQSSGDQNPPKKVSTAQLPPPKKDEEETSPWKLYLDELAMIEVDLTDDMKRFILESSEWDWTRVGHDDDEKRVLWNSFVKASCWLQFQCI